MAVSSPRIPIKELGDGQLIEQAFRVGDKQLRVNRQGGKYVFLRLSDRTGNIVGMLWNADQRVSDSFDRGDFVHCQGRTQVHNGVLQVILTEIQRMDPSEVDAAEFDQFDAARSEGLFVRLRQLIGGIGDVTLRRLGEVYLADDELMNRMRTAAAAVAHHHAYPGGLLQHTVDMMELSQLVGDRYPRLNRDLLMMGAFLHDLGKIDELSGGGEIAYTDRGQMLGHIVIGVQLLGEKVSQLQSLGVTLDPTLRLHLEHLIVSHHGTLEYGSPKIPVTLEAIALHYIDNLDAKLSSFTHVIDSDISTDGSWTNYTPSIGRKLWKR